MIHHRGQRHGRPALLAAVLATLLALGTTTADAQEATAQEPSAPQEPAAELVVGDTDLPPIPDPPRFISGLSRTFADVAGDLFFWGQGATLDGPIAYNAVLGGSSVFVTGDTRVGGDLVAFAGDVAIDGEVIQNAYIWAGTARIGEGAVIHGNVLCFCGTLRVEGTVRGLVQGGGGNTAITGDVGSVKVEAGIITVGPEAVIRGDLEYEANDEADIAEGATIMGEVRRTIERDDEEADDEADSGGISAWTIGWRVWSYLSRLLIGVAFLLVGGRLARAPAAHLRETPAAGLGFGFVVAVVVPVACLIAIGLIVSLPLGLIGLVLFGLAVTLSSLVTSQFLGEWLLRRVRDGAPSEYAALALGLLLLTVVGFIPYVGFLIWLTAILLGLGGMFLALRPHGAGQPASPAISPSQT
jgi:hypothetical protein